MASVSDYNWAVVNPDGTVGTQATPNNTSENTVGTTALGKDAFLKLLVTQMQYQDPLNPSSDTEWIAQMAQFSSLEAMQNMGQTMTNTQAFQLVGQYVIVDENAGGTGNPKLVAGLVDYITLQGGEAYISMDGNTYSYDKLDSVVSNDYIKTLAESSSAGKATADDIVEMLQQILDKSSSGTSALWYLSELCEKIENNTTEPDSAESDEDAADSEESADTAAEASGTEASAETADTAEDKTSSDVTA